MFVLGHNDEQLVNGMNELQGLDGLNGERGELGLSLQDNATDAIDPASEQPPPLFPIDPGSPHDSFMLL